MRAMHTRGAKYRSQNAAQQEGLNYRWKIRWRGMVWYGVIWCGWVWCGVVWCGVVWCGVVWCGMVWHVVMWCGWVRCGWAWCSLVRLGTMWYGAVGCCPYPPPWFRYLPEACPCAAPSSELPPEASRTPSPLGRPPTALKPAALRATQTFPPYHHRPFLLWLLWLLLPLWRC